MAGEWYFVANCKACSQRLVIAHDPESKIAGGGVRVEIEGGGTVNITCQCGQTHEYRRDEIKSVQAE
ncbi:MAG: hypothetical protein DME00_29210 [Candidatus Rokuibacteriota bacterium]|nr:MAG: hypothetical protein DME00_29210 [Candidatus Rokubacteria bacterium]PYO07728.1 MAG: hypothetical protein DMD75_20155 [Candidatus Rokubacteria bacterium]